MPHVNTHFEIAVNVPVLKYGIAGVQMYKQTMWKHVIALGDPIKFHFHCHCSLFRGILLEITIKIHRI